LNRLEIEKKLQIAISNCLNVNIDFNQIGKEDNLFSLGLDSVQGIKLLVVIEEQFDIEFYDDEYSLENFKSIGSIINLIQSHVSSATPEI